MALYVLFNVFAVAGLLVGARAAHSASKAHRRTAEVLREMAETWGAISQAQTFIRCGRYEDANRELDRAAQVLIAGRRRALTALDGNSASNGAQSVPTSSHGKGQRS